MRLSLRLLRSFVTTIDQGSITSAAEVLNIAPSAVAAALDRVEAEFGASLVVRARAKGITATPAGKTLAMRIRPLLDDYSAVMQQGYALGRGLTGTLRIGYYAPVAPAFLPDILKTLADKSEDLRLILRECDNVSAQSGLLDGTLDVGIFAGDEVMPGVDTKPLLDLPPYVLAGEGHPLVGETFVQLTDLTDMPIILLDLPVANAYVHGLFRTAGFAPNFIATASSVEMVRSLVGSGMGVAILNMKPGTDHSYAGDRLSAIPIAANPPGLHLVSGRTAGPPRRLIEAFQDLLHLWFEQPEAQDLIVRP